jgi:hypothetical protein
MTEMVERVARVLHAKYYADSMGGRAGDPAEEAWSRLAKYDEQDYWRDHARCAIEAMREPTYVMLSAGAGVPVASGCEFADVDETTAEEFWRVMIAAALAD